MNARIVLVTTPSPALARKLARMLVLERLAACANILPGVTSTYLWRGRVEQSSEALMVLKTTAARLSRLQARVLELHPYDTPEFVALEAAHVEPRYLAWLMDSLKPAAKPRRRVSADRRSR